MYAAQHRQHAMKTDDVTFIVITHSGVARICCEEGQSWRLCHRGTRGGLQGRVQQLLDD